ncbi:MAG: hypothetical protein LBD35_01785 [Prevotellaceae bacterium]|jgi:hypothetical protein|nr:hypothetical protein [Prevotellaceae bacterium]
MSTKEIIVFAAFFTLCANAGFAKTATESDALLRNIQVGISENYAKAREYTDVARSLYPDNYMINQHAETLGDKK